MVKFKIKVFTQIGRILVKGITFEAETHQEAREGKYAQVIKSIHDLPDGEYCSEIYEWDDKNAHFPNPPFISKNGIITFY